jgi:hypothetical protein
VNFEFAMTNDGIELTENQRDECRSYAIAEILCRYHAEFKAEHERLIAQKLEWVKAQVSSISSNNTNEVWQ